MKRLSVLVCCTFLLYSGCQQNDISQDGDSVEGGEDFVIEVWRGQGHGWTIYMGADGSIPEVYRSEGLHMDLSEGGVEKGSPDNEIFVHYLYGDCFWSYDSETNNLKATVTLDNYYVNAGGVELSCAIVDEFEGPLSPDKMTWIANWKTITTLDANKPEQISTGRKLIFNKIP